MTRARAAVIAAAVALVVALPALRNGFAIDDFYLVVDNAAVHSLRTVPRLFAEPWGNGAGHDAMYTRVNAASYRPVTSTLFAVEYSLFGARAAPFHATSALLHALVAALVTLLCATLLGSTRGGLIAGLVFAAHPVHSEVIAAVTYQTTLCEALFSLVALVVFGRVLARAGRAHAAELVALATLPALALWSKEEAVTLPLLALAWALLSRPPGWRRALVAGVVPMALSTIAALAARAAIVAPSGITFFGDAPRFTIVRTMLATIALYLELLIAPVRLCVFYDWFIVPFETAWSARVLVGAAIVVVFIAVLVVSMRRAPLVALGLAWLALPLGVVLQIVPILNVAAERFLYLPSLGFCLVVAWLLLRLSPRAADALVAVVVVALAARTMARLPAWHDDRTLNRATAADFPETPIPWMNLAQLDERDGHVDAARAELQEALRRAPGYPPALDRLRALDGAR